MSVCGTFTPCRGTRRYVCSWGSSSRPKAIDATEEDDPQPTFLRLAFRTALGDSPDQITNCLSTGDGSALRHCQPKEGPWAGAFCLTIPSQPPDSTRPPSGENATALTLWSNVRSGDPLAAWQKTTGHHRIFFSTLSRNWLWRLPMSANDAHAQADHDWTSH